MNLPKTLFTKPKDQTAKGKPVFGPMNKDQKKTKGKKKC